MIDLNELEVEITEVGVGQEEYEKRVVRLVNWLLEFDDANVQGQDEQPSEVAA
jgi:hypothetical protein